MIQSISGLQIQSIFIIIILNFFIFKKYLFLNFNQTIKQLFYINIQYIGKEISIFLLKI